MPAEERTTLGMTDGHLLHEAHILGGAIEPAGAFTAALRDAPGDVTLLELSGELDIAATAAVRSYLDEAAGRRGIVLDLSGAKFVDSSMLKELLRANAELSRAGTRLVLAGAPLAVRRVLELTRTTALFTLADDCDTGLELASA